MPNASEDDDFGSSASGSDYEPITHGDDHPTSSPINNNDQMGSIDNASLATSTPLNPKFQCRMYEAVYPEVNDLVLVTVKSIADMGAYVSLAEYNGIEGMVLLSELSRRRIRSVHRLIRVGKSEVVVVVRVDKEKGYIDLSKKRVSPEDVAKFEEKYNKSKMVTFHPLYIFYSISGFSFVYVGPFDNETCGGEDRHRVGMAVQGCGVAGL